MPTKAPAKAAGVHRTTGAPGVCHSSGSSEPPELAKDSICVIRFTLRSAEWVFRGKQPSRRPLGNVTLSGRSETSHPPEYLFAPLDIPNTGKRFRENHEPGHPARHPAEEHPHIAEWITR